MVRKERNQFPEFKEQVRLLNESWDPVSSPMFIPQRLHFCKGLVTNYGEGGGLQNRRGGMRSFTTTKRGGGKSFSHAEGGAQKVLG